MERKDLVDKHCIGGIPGNRTSMIVVPIVAAHGLTIPKTSSRAITSPAGTADTMEVLARVDLSVEAMKEVVASCNGCLAWGGHVNLSPADDILISVERPLSLDTHEQMVASIGEEAGRRRDAPSHRTSGGTQRQAYDRTGSHAASEAVSIRRRSFGISPELSLAGRRTLLDWGIRPALRTVPGVADVNALGGYVRAFEIVPRSDALAARGISYDLFRRAIEANSRNDGAGRVKQGEDSALVRVEGSIHGVDDIRSIVVDTRDGVPIRVNDVARVKSGALTRYGAVTADGRGETVEGLVLGLRGANAGQLVRDVRARVAELQPSLPKSVSINVFYDRSHLVNRAVGTVVRALGEATVLVIVLLLLFLARISHGD